MTSSVMSSVKVKKPHWTQKLKADMATIQKQNDDLKLLNTSLMEELKKCGSSIIVDAVPSSSSLVGTEVAEGGGDGGDDGGSGSSDGDDEEKPQNESDHIEITIIYMEEKFSFKVHTMASFLDLKCQLYGMRGFSVFKQTLCAEGGEEFDDDMFVDLTLQDTTHVVFLSLKDEEPDEEEHYEVFIRENFGNLATHSFMVEHDKSDRVYNIMFMISGKTGIPYGIFKFIYRGDTVDENHRVHWFLEELHGEDGRIVFLMTLGLLGGMPQTKRKKPSLTAMKPLPNDSVMVKRCFEIGGFNELVWFDTLPDEKKVSYYEALKGNRNYPAQIGLTVEHITEFSTLKDRTSCYLHHVIQNMTFLTRCPDVMSRTL